MPAQDTNDEVSTGLAVLGWTVADPARAARLLDLTGLSPADLRASADTPATLAAVIAFLEGHEPDLVACADTLDITPEALVALRHRLERL